ncbi:MAG: ATP-binding protein [Acidobacteriota bacterium]
MKNFMMVQSIEVKQYKITGRDFKNAGRVSEEIKMLLEQMKFNPEIVRRASICIFEAEMNVVMYAQKGVVDFLATPEKIEIVVRDIGIGIPDIEKAMQPGYSTATEEMREMGFGAGMGLPNIKENADCFEIASDVGKGTRLTIILNSKVKNK